MNIGICTLSRYIPMEALSCLFSENANAWHGSFSATRVIHKTAELFSGINSSHYHLNPINSMKTKIRQLLAIACLSAALTSCATVFGGPRTAYQVTKPVEGGQQREVRVGALIADILLFWPGLIVDFATGAIYKPAPTKAAYVAPK
jgi:hypothetical protein